MKVGPGTVGLGGGLHTEMVCPSDDSHAQYYRGPMWSNFVDRDEHSTLPLSHAPKSDHISKQQSHEKTCRVCNVTQMANVARLHSNNNGEMTKEHAVLNKLSHRDGIVPDLIIRAWK